MPVDLGAETFAAYERNLARAKRLTELGRLADAAALYRRCAADLASYSEYVLAPQVRAGWLEKARGYRDLAERLEREQVALPVREAETGPDDYADAVMGLIFRSSVTWEDIAGLEQTKREIKSAYGLSLARKPLGVSLAGWRSVLFYGPPGTGKTLLAAATSNGLAATFFNVKVSDMLSKYFGESSRMISALFEAARSVAPAVIFLDEIEALSPSRDDSQSGAEARVVSTVLSELDGLAQKGDQRYVLTIGATNLPWLIDRAVLSRFEKLIYVPLPDGPARRGILALELDGKGLSTDAPRDELVARSDGYSGRELSQIVREAAKEMIARANPGLVGAVDQGMEAVSAYELRVEPISSPEWAVAFERVPKRTRLDDLRRYDAWRRSLE